MGKIRCGAVTAKVIRYALKPFLPEERLFVSSTLGAWVVSCMFMIHLINE